MLNIFTYLIIALGVNLVMFIPAFRFKTDTLTDFSYSLTFIMIILLAFYVNDFSWAKLAICFMVVLWALRLGIFLVMRIRRIKSDRRFDGMRDNFLRFLKFWILQGLSVWVILIPALMTMSTETRITSLTWIGLAVWLGGFLIESIADMQKYSFMQLNTGKWIQHGLWKYSRHPNYFGEICCWVGVFLFAFSSLAGYQRAVAFVSPLYITVLLVYVTGRPPLEKQADRKWSGDRNYQEYKRKTSVLVPWFTGKSNTTG
jgi:steroid 5-alpha reductase family enzyme